MGDREVVASVVAGDPAGLAEAYDRYAPALHAYCRSMLREPADAADAVQDTFVIAASRLRDLRAPDRLRPWLYAVARNVCLRKLRADKAAAGLAPALSAPLPQVRPGGPDRASGAGVPAEPGGVADIGDRAELAELRALIRDAAGGLTWRDREILRLRLWEGLGSGEASSVLGVSRGYANALFTRARDQLTVCVGALLVARAGRAECADLGRILANWDGQLTILLRKRLSRHIEQCDTCSGRRRRELVPALLSLSPGAAIAAAGALGGAADALGGAAPHATGAQSAVHGVAAATTHPGQVAGAGLPAGFKAKMLAAAAGHSEPAAGSFGRNGFPKPPHHGGPWLARASQLRATAGHDPLTVAAGAAAVAAAVAVAVALALPGGGRPGPAPGGAPGPASPAPGHIGPADGRRGAAPGHGRSQPGNNRATPGGAAAVLTQASQTAATAPTSGNAVPPGSEPSGTAPSAPNPRPTSPGSSPPASPATGRVSITPTTVLLTPLLGGTLTLTAEGGPVSWSISERSSLLGSLTVSPSSGYLAAGASTTVTISTSSLASLDTTLTATPGDVDINVLLGAGATRAAPPMPGPDIFPNGSRLLTSRNVLNDEHDRKRFDKLRNRTRVPFVPEHEGPGPRRSGPGTLASEMMF